MSNEPQEPQHTTPLSCSNLTLFLISSPHWMCQTLKVGWWALNPSSHMFVVCSIPVHLRDGSHGGWVMLELCVVASTTPQVLCSGQDCSCQLCRTASSWTAVCFQEVAYKRSLSCTNTLTIANCSHLDSRYISITTVTLLRQIIALLQDSAIWRHHDLCQEPCRCSKEGQREGWSVLSH